MHLRAYFQSELPSKDKSLPCHPDDDDNDLENAIGEAFKSISDIKGKDRKQEEQVNDDELKPVIAQSFQKAVIYRNQILILIMIHGKCNHSGIQNGNGWH